MILTEGDSAPDFTLNDSSGNTILLGDFRGRKVVLYFYPKDDTPGCSIEACSFRDDKHLFDKQGVIILGISPDANHLMFIDKFLLNFTLLCDTDHKVAEAYRVWGERPLYSGKFMGILRSTFIINELGIITKIFRNVKPEGHTKEVFAAL